MRLISFHMCDQVNWLNVVDHVSRLFGGFTLLLRKNPVLGGVSEEKLLIEAHCTCTFDSSDRLKEAEWLAWLF